MMEIYNRSGFPEVINLSPPAAEFSSEPGADIIKGMPETAFCKNGPKQEMKEVHYGKDQTEKNRR